MDAVSPLPNSPSPRPQAVVPREAAPAGPPPGPTGTAPAPTPLPRAASEGPAQPSFDAPPPPLSVQREQLRPPEVALMTTAQMTELLNRMLVGGG